MRRWPRVGKPDKIRAAALVEFAARGVEATSLREVASRAGVSVGLIQHHFGSKAVLVEAVDRHVTDLLRTALASGPGAVTVDDFGEQVMALLVQHPGVVDYLARSLVDETPFGSMIFDNLIEMGIARWERRSKEGHTVADLDTPWAAINVIALFIGTVLLRSHIERQLPASLLSPAQMVRWGTAVNKLLAQGYSR